MVIGGGNSGRDIALQLSKTANRVTWSRRKSAGPTDEERKIYGKNVTFKSDAKILTKNGAEFIDGTHQDYTVIIYATGSLTEATFYKVSVRLIIFIFQVTQIRLQFLMLTPAFTWMKIMCNHFSKII